MKLLSISLLRWNDEVNAEPVFLCSDFELSSFTFFQRSTVQQTLTFAARLVAKRTPAGTRLPVEHQGYMCYSYRHTDGLTCITICDKEYPQRVAFSIGWQLIQDFEVQYTKDRWIGIMTDNTLPLKNLHETLIKAQNPADVDQLTKVQDQLDETKQVAIKSLDALLERGEKLEDLAEKKAKVFVKSTPSGCCVIF